jgi:ATP-dependent DNA helicase RecG
MKMIDRISGKMDTSPITPELLNQGMDESLHWFPEDIPLSRLAAALVSMANTSGGRVILGVSPHSGEIIGVHQPDEVIDRVLQAALLTDPPLVLPIPISQRLGIAQVVCVTVPAGLPNVYSMDGRYLGREGHQINPLSARRLRKLLMERGVLQFDSEYPQDATLDDLDPQKISDYIAVFGLLVAETPEEVLIRRGCLRRDRNGALHPTYATLLLFGRSPQRWLPNATLLAARFPGVAFSDHYLKQEITGTLPEQLRQAEAFLRANLRSVVRLMGLTHQEALEYPFEAVRELLVNAIAHRDYSLQGDCIHLHIFSDRLEVHSPGELPGPVTLDNLLEARYSRNAVIVQALADLGFVERLGYGLDRVVTVMRQNTLPPPLFEEVAGSFRVTLYGPAITPPAAPLPDLSAYRGLNLNPRQQMALGYIAQHRRITNSEYQALCPDVHSETLRRDLADLVSRGVLIKVGDKKATYYILK